MVGPSGYGYLCPPGAIGLVATAPPLTSAEWPYLQALVRLALALALGLFVGLERERRGKEAGVRTFAFAALLGCLGGLLGESYALLSLVFVGALVTFLNVKTLLSNQTTQLVTSASLMVLGFAGVLTGQGHTLTPTALAVLTAALLAWKESLTSFSLGLTDAELRSAVLLGVLAFVIYPALPEGSVDPWGRSGPDRPG
jgi:MgtC family